MTRWRRPYPPGPFRIVTLLLLVAGAALLGYVSVQLVSSSARLVSGVTWVSLVAVYGFTVVWLGFVWRLHRLGVYVSPAGVRVVNPLRTRTVSWEDVRGFRLAPAELPWRLGPTPYRVSAVWLDVAGGSTIQTSLTSRSGDYWWRPKAFRRAYLRLSARHDAARAAPTA